MTWRPLPEPGGRPPRPLAASLDAVTRNLGGDGGPALVTLLRDWAAVVGDQLAAHSRPLTLRGGTLTIAADEGAWATQLRWLEADLLRSLEAALGPAVVTRVSVRVRPR